ncbi:MAG: epoxyqueuosine reductase [bacterium]|nr:epoxyqueuosine reductase [bacterium]
MTESIKTTLVNRLKQVGAFDVRIANPEVGFDKVPKQSQPLSLYPECKSVVVFALAMPPSCNNIYLGPRSPGKPFRNLGPVPNDIQSGDFAMDRLSRLFVTNITHKGMMLLTNNGYSVSFHRSPFKISAYESGLGIYGRSGLILHPILGNRMSLGVILTNAPMPPDPKLEDYVPCKNCDKCIQKCPAKAYNPDKQYPEAWSINTCMQKRTQIADKGYYCHNCFVVCPACTIDDRNLLNSRMAENFNKNYRFACQDITEQGGAPNADKLRR